MKRALLQVKRYVLEYLWAEPIAEAYILKSDDFAHFYCSPYRDRYRTGAESHAHPYPCLLNNQDFPFKPPGIKKAIN
tara:strand:+ start:144 stop:374 length:231 start_codon:yes stop_codon:yes gene_type:complete